jgi:hypothetical protein
MQHTIKARNDRFPKNLLKYASGEGSMAPSPS